jgi:hypothetical protein
MVASFDYIFEILSKGCPPDVLCKRRGILYFAEGLF